MSELNGKVIRQNIGLASDEVYIPIDLFFSDGSWMKGTGAIKKDVTLDKFMSMANEEFFEELWISHPYKLNIYLILDLNRFLIQEVLFVL